MQRHSSIPKRVVGLLCIAIVLVLFSFSMGYSFGRTTISGSEHTMKKLDVSAKETPSSTFSKVELVQDLSEGFCDALAHLPSGPQNNFLSIALKAGTDKVTSHSYHIPYQELLGPLSTPFTTPFKLIEIGFASGWGADAWTKFLPAADVHEIEIGCTEDTRGMDQYQWIFDAPLFQRFMNSGRLHCGDGSDPGFIKSVLKKIGEPPLVVIDDGGHGPVEMKGAFLHLFPHIAPCGYFIMEDLQESFVVGMRGFLPSVLGPLIMKDLHYDPNYPPTSQLLTNPSISKYLRSIRCFQHLCVFQRNDVPPKLL